MDEPDFDSPDLGPADVDDGPEGDEKIRCWCGAVGTFDELFSDEPYDESCGGSGFLYCYCGGDQCVCDHHGQEIECPGCEDCDGIEDLEERQIEHYLGDDEDGPEDVGTRYEDDDQVGEVEGLEGEGLDDR